LLSITIADDGDLSGRHWIDAGSLFDGSVQGKTGFRTRDATGTGVYGEGVANWAGLISVASPFNLGEVGKGFTNFDAGLTIDLAIRCYGDDGQLPRGTCIGTGETTTAPGRELGEGLGSPVTIAPTAANRQTTMRTILIVAEFGRSVPPGEPPIAGTKPGPGSSSSKSAQHCPIPHGPGAVCSRLLRHAARRQR
jgi:hypothetical protein